MKDPLLLSKVEIVSSWLRSPSSSRVAMLMTSSWHTSTHSTSKEHIEYLTDIDIYNVVGDNKSIELEEDRGVERSNHSSRIE